MDTAHDITVLLEAFGQALHAEDASRHTASAYCADSHHFLTWLVQTVDTCRLDEITPTAIHEYRELLQEQIPPAAPATINRRLAALHRFFAWAKEQQLTEVQPTEHIRNVESTEHGPRSLIASSGIACNGV